MLTSIVKLFPTLLCVRAAGASFVTNGTLSFMAPSLRGRDKPHGNNLCVGRHIDLTFQKDKEAETFHSVFFICFAYIPDDIHDD